MGFVGSKCSNISSLMAMVEIFKERNDMCEQCFVDFGAFSNVPLATKV